MPNRAGCGDITYVSMQGRWHYMAAVLDVLTPEWRPSAKYISAQEARREIIRYPMHRYN